MTEYKYLKDGRKVVVIGKLNDAESIVQEVYVTDAGDEIPSGERFTTNDLHDQPVKSYKEKQAEKIELQYNQWVNKRDVASTECENVLLELKKLRMILSSSKKLVEHIEEKELDHFLMFMTGSANWIVMHSYQLNAPIKFTDGVSESSRFDGWNGGRSFEGIKLMSVLGNSDGNIEYRISQYPDGSGGSETCRLFDNYDDALDYIKALAIHKIQDNRLSIKEYSLLKELGIVLSDEIKQIYTKHRKSEVAKIIESKKAEILKKESEISALQSEEYH